MKSSQAKQRKFRSWVWEHYDYVVEDGMEYAKCKKCTHKTTAESKMGTKHLINHVQSCHRKRNPSGGADKSIGASDVKTLAVAGAEKSMFDQALDHLDWIRSALKFWVTQPTLNDKKDVILDLLKEEKKKWGRYYDKLSCRFNLKLEFLDERHSLMVLHFIDDNWELKKKIIGLQCEEDDTGLMETLKDLLTGGNVNICSIVRSEDMEDEKDFGEINSWLRSGSLPFAGQLFSVGWLAYLLKDCVGNGPNQITEVLSKVKQFFNHAGTPSNSHGLSKIGLSEFDLLERAMGDNSFQHLLTKDELEKATVAYNCWKDLKDAAGSLHGRKYTTANVYFPLICNIYLKLFLWGNDENDHVREVASSTRERFFDNYWSSSNLVLVIAVFLDPRCKMNIVYFWYKKIYGNDADAFFRRIIENVSNIYNEYAKCYNNSKSYTPDHGGVNSTVHAMEMDVSASSKSELVCYQGTEFSSDEKFDILNWWHDNSQRFPILARMARDFLAVPVAYEISDVSLTEEIESIIFDSRLDVDIKRALVCMKTWL